MVAFHLAALVVLAGSVPEAVGSTKPAEQLIVFVAPDASQLAKSFQRDHLSNIREAARDLDLPFRVVEVSGGAPAEVALTPLIVYQNHRGRSIYQGRYTGVDRIRNFIRTARLVPQGEAQLTKRQAAVWRAGRTQVVGLLKVADVTGDRPTNYDRDDFVARATRAIFAGFDKFELVDTVTVRRSDRMFYLDFNPWRAKNGTLYLSVALYSQFHCKEPIFTRPGETFTEPWRKRDRLFRRAAVSLEKAVLDAMASSPVGDGFDPVPTSIPTVTWSSLGLDLPPRPADAPRQATGPPLGRRWKLSSAGSDGSTQLAFHFPAPLDSYSGEVATLRGELEFAADLTARSARGFFEADPRSVTMGDPDLDQALEGSAYLDATNHPTSRFEIESVEADSTSLAYGRLSPVTMRGTFSMKGVSIPLSVRAFFEPIIGAAGTPELMVSGRFQISLAPFSIDGPDGPAPAKETIVFDFDFRFRPASN